MASDAHYNGWLKSLCLDHRRRGAPVTLVLDQRIMTKSQV